MSARLRHTLVYAAITAALAPVQWLLGLLDADVIAAIIVSVPIAYWCGFADGERYGDVAQKAHSRSCK